ncbi:MAG TPA: type II secretion system F family protein [Bacillota bacterium]|nr:type II secretion system F family protein [Bacillota bacterium]
MASLSWSYRGRDMSGQVVEGTMEAENPETVAERLRSEGYVPVMITEAKRSVFSADASAASGKKVQAATSLDTMQLSLISRQMSTMVAAGIPLVQTLAILSQQIEDPRIAELINEVRRSVESGETFAASLAKHPGCFPPLFVHMVEAGEASGTLDIVMNRVANYYEQQVKIRSQLKNALVYPIILVAVALVVVVILMAFVLPTFIDMFEGFDMELPWVTRAVFGYGQSVQRAWYLHFGIPIVAIVWFVSYVKGAGKSWWDHTAIRLKISGPIIRKSQTAQFARTFAMLTQSGVPMLQSLDILERLSDNAVVRETVEASKISVRDGAGLARPLRQSQIFPPMLAHMVAVGEETGNLDGMLNKTADFFDQEVEYEVQRVTTAIEPIMTLIIGLFVALIVASVMIPMFNMASFGM